ncbi:SDR family NAD(P)-dependent oxidoreductase [Virgibacillus necropolis]|uniref:Short-chain dehydrogenase n=1 Tax=Virgibacillus necropolis TaxID=163877 RepID=A0A221MF76_9BACI|nr:glucose 1-dehydrogenase [Virgibacillus necropolis]ASN06291.1 short-chain dehydrogenase [Virgibacillus necropolis]
MTNNQEVFDLKDKVSVITGASSGIGLATAERLAEFGSHVLMLDINELGKKMAANIVEKGGKASFKKCNVTSSEDCKRVTSEIESEFGRIDVLFNNAGVIRRRNVVELEEEDWDQVVNVSLKGVYLLSKYVIPVMEKGGGGSIINTGSGWGLKGGDNAAAYCAAKAGVVNLTRAMAIDHGVQNIRVNCVCPGDTETALLKDEARQLNLDEKSFLTSSAKGRPLERLGTPNDIANAVLFLSSGLSSWITGTVLPVDGGGLA